jgi:putative membrane protein
MSLKRYILIFLFFFLIPPLELLWAHNEGAHGSSWNWDPLVIISLLLLTMAYLKGLKNLDQKRKQHEEGRSLSKKEISFFATSILFLVIALMSPVDQWSDELQAWHMIQHMLIMMLAAPFFVLAVPLLVFLWSLPLGARRKIIPLYRWLYGYRSGWYFMWQPILLWSVFALTLWVWHLPSLYEAALHSPWIHDLQHISFFIVACLFWRVLLDPIHRFKMGRALGIVYLFATTLHATLLGVFMTLSPKLWYGFYEGRTSPWSLTALEDQQLAGLIMWMPACMIYVVVTVFIFINWLKENSSLEESWKEV